jgi:hypothetical protein
MWDADRVVKTTVSKLRHTSLLHRGEYCNICYVDQELVNGTYTKVKLSRDKLRLLQRYFFAKTFCTRERKTVKADIGSLSTRLCFLVRVYKKTAVTQSVSYPVWPVNANFDERASECWHYCVGCTGTKGWRGTRRRMHEESMSVNATNEQGRFSDVCHRHLLVRPDISLQRGRWTPRVLS